MDNSSEISLQIYYTRRDSDEEKTIDAVRHCLLGAHGGFTLFYATLG
jgi:hypothetical protein